MTELHALPHFLLTRGIALTCTLLLSAAALLLAGQNPWLAQWYAQYLETAAALLLGISSTGALLLEDVMRKSR